MNATPYIYPYCNNFGYPLVAKERREGSLSTTKSETNETGKIALVWAYMPHWRRICPS